MMRLAEMSADELQQMLRHVRAEYDAIRARKLKLNIARGRPGEEQLDLSNELLSLPKPDDWITEAGDDARNYGGDPKGLVELRRIFAPILDVPVEQVVVGGNSSLAIMHDVIVWALLKGVTAIATPWMKQGRIAFLSPVPGYELHHNMCIEYGIDLIPVPVTPKGPDMKVVEHHVRDPRVKGMWCVPTYANPTGEIWSDEAIDRLAAMEAAATDFRLFWDDAYVVHHLADNSKPAKRILPACAAAGNADRPLMFWSTSKITFATAGIGFFAASPANVRWFLDCAKRRGAGQDKLNQLRHARFLKDAGGVTRHMKRHRAILAPKFSAVLQAFERRLAGKGAAVWTRPEGGYFISVDTIAGAAQRAVRLAGDAGISLTAAGSTFPNGHDPKDSNIRIAPSFASLEDVRIAAEAIAISILLAAVEKQLGINDND
ncbi:aminotransferase class I/II-fold pyridoxal phosphate-dependent enzyme [Bradyrhizobium guangdongense]|uniref:Aminotransferase n=2 Tax=Bradyrhizobium guangdongense TaxID=1325090 RepID=A0ABX6UWE0_9BRAD|nr:aminotransferase class I/II-fold pyridoxal phosphate-dependent enzyme [Bradyrhizobium guangdongense]QAU43873.1 aminotransferase [Bradyrhizobium guangdongense]QOZ64879.1 aminotransferase [Bradyrhizobium guangdongense]